MKICLITFATLLCYISSYAQTYDRWGETPANYDVRYQGEVNFSYVFGTGSNPYNRIGCETVHGARLSPLVFCGAGVGVSHFYASEEDTYTFVPVFAAFRFYFIDRRVSPYLKIDVGYGIGNNGRLYASPSIGVKCSLAHRIALNFDLGFQIQQINEYGSTDTLGGLMLKLGCSF